MACKIIPLIPEHTVYVEPYAGGACVMFTREKPAVSNTDHYREVLNDTNQLVYNFYEQLQTNGKALAEKISLTPYSEQFYRKAKAICNNGGSDFDKAWAFFVNISQSFANKINGGWGRSVIGRNHSRSWYNQIDNLNRFLERMDGVYLSDTDAITCIKQWDSPQTFFYCDPPYVNTNQGHYSGYTQADLDNLIELLDSIEGSFILSGYENNAYPDTWERFEFEAYSSAANGKGNGRGKSTEIVLRKISAVPVRNDIQRIYDKKQQLELFQV